MRRISSILLLSLILVLGVTVAASAHFQMILPSDDVVMQGEEREIDLDLVFTHPMAGHTMDMEKPAKFGVLHKGTKKSLVDTLEPSKIKGRDAFETSYRLRGFGDFVFYVEPEPYWESADGVYITQCTKMVVNSMGVASDWGKEVGMKAEIVPLTRPYGLWTNNVFTGVVKKNGKPVPYAEIEVEYFNEGKFSKLAGNEVTELPNETFTTQVIKADKNGVFTYAMPKSGWWGFAALMEGEPVNGKSHEIGAVMWVKTHDMK
ncbi:DUF4198 domain-containing protein [Acetohalobium arabaticum]|uniref:Nickel transport complex, NikM subunit, transmembrane n=1 Tax=Acetohalobium arabaticum (strain ATCC 49924 / DSM 5501 / Z-7288) TaxID=574087 RepID=D9QVQ6_ACEAZ|nr:DUF4198 domain-containing protein [Acetohalobium arabaticum]ADL12315.1 Nickel transport complex, NikM subunit, transmembrane [Acetohalobium arabaticum DSM 5501]